MNFRRFLPALMCLILMTIVVPALGQTVTGELDPENIEPLTFSRPIWEYISAGGFLVAALALGFMPSKRTAG